MRKTIRKDIIPLLISVILVIISIGITLFTEYVLNYKHYVGIGLVGISSVLYFKNKKLYVYIFGLTLIVGIINLIDIYYSNISFGIGLIKFNPIFLTLFIIFLTLNKELLNKLFPEKKLNENDLAEKNAENENLIKNYELKFQSKTESELKSIADEKSGYVNEAKIASKNVLRNKYVL
ncbi:hypothetical protein JBL43_03440 [Aureibaculum sp. A20]|uniref:Uncharacterized protein n=1 Tax=Aureibaculum flavum TaxID=2795986 RepID=A0ABS0WMT2_9FLAO|nr:hypothetical protein [Aureibaculum flavum]MBJ2173273.1 hypothetical protein [Aureibaculum flavum]